MNHPGAVDMLLPGRAVCGKKSVISTKGALVYKRGILMRQSVHVY